MIQLLHQLRHAFLPALLLAASGALAAGLPDTGQDACYTNNAADSVAASSPSSVSADGGTYPRQDCRYGLDPAAASATPPVKIGGGAKGFDYTPLDASGGVITLTGSPPTPSATPACTRDNITGLTWEVKSAISTDLRYSGHTYSWYNTDVLTNGGVAGTANGGVCSGGSGCDTEKFVSDVNTAGLCAIHNWRMPTQRELLTLVLADASSVSIDTNYFPNTPTTLFFYWSASTFARFPDTAWVVRALEGRSYNDSKSGPLAVSYYVRLVSGGPF